MGLISACDSSFPDGIHPRLRRLGKFRDLNAESCLVSEDTYVTFPMCLTDQLKVWERLQLLWSDIMLPTSYICPSLSASPSAFTNECAVDQYEICWYSTINNTCIICSRKRSSCMMRKLRFRGTWWVSGDWGVACLGQTLEATHYPNPGFLCNAKIIQKLLWKKLDFQLVKVTDSKI